MGPCDPWHRGVLLGCWTPIRDHSSCKDHCTRMVVRGHYRFTPPVAGDHLRPDPMIRYATHPGSGTTPMTPSLRWMPPRRCLSGFRGVAAAARPHEPPSLNLVRSCAVVPLGQTSAQGTAEGPSPLVVSFWCLGPHADHDQSHHRVMGRTWSSASLIKRNGGGSFG